MQNMHVNGDVGGGEMFIGVGDRRLRPHNHLNHQALKCPRCDSLNTKFCYYNNYNLSQPRHFCKSCRRYWTKGGILRSVPVGGGCRKTKRSKAKSSAGDAPRESKSNAQSSSSESSSLTTAAPAGATTPPTNTTSSSVMFNPTNTTSSSSTVMFNLSDAMFSNANPQAYSNLDHVNHTSADGQIFPTDVGSFTSLMTSSEEMIGFGTRRIPEQPVNQAAETDNPSAGAVDELDMSNEGLAAALDWGSGGGGSDHGLFDLTAGVDQSYWNQSEWTDNDRSVNYLP